MRHRVTKRLFFRPYRSMAGLMLLIGMSAGWAAAPLGMTPLGREPLRFQVSQRPLSTVIGWHWYNKPLQEKKSDTPQAKESTEKSDNTQKTNGIKKPLTLSPEAWVAAFHQLPPLPQLRLLQAVTTERRVKAVLSGKVEDIAAYKAAQDFWVRRATAFTVGWEQMLLRYPERDYSLTYSHQNFLASIMQRTRHQEERRAIETLRKQHGLVFFYRGGAPEDRLFSGMVYRFAQRYRFRLIPVSVDGKTSPNFPESRVDTHHQKAAAMGVQFVPALVLVNPQQQHTQVVSYGAQSESDLAARFWRLAHHWQAGF